MKVAIIGGGAAGFFAAIHVKENFPNATVTIFEKSKKVLAKVKISGGGRCNVTNGTRSIKDLSEAYPRGNKKLKKIFPIFNTKHAYEWFEQHGVPLTTQADNCVFPQSQNSQSIIDCFTQQTKRLNIAIKMQQGVKKIIPKGTQLELTYTLDVATELFDKVIVTTGGSPKSTGLDWIKELGHEIEQPCPSLFTFNMPNEKVKTLMGVVVQNAKVKIEGSKLKAEGPLLITHWGMSGPAILKLSAFGARYLFEKDYHFTISVNWIDTINYEAIANELNNITQLHPNKLLSNFRPYALPERLWLFLLEKCEFKPTKKWCELGKKGNNLLIEILSNDSYKVAGKTTFKEEFVTCGGVSLNNINIKTMESTICKNLYFAGEILDIDGITGGYNFQAAWTTGFVAAKLG